MTESSWPIKEMLKAVPLTACVAAVLIGVPAKAGPIWTAVTMALLVGHLWGALLNRTRFHGALAALAAGFPLYEGVRLSGEYWAWVLLLPYIAITAGMFGRRALWAASCLSGLFLIRGLMDNPTKLSLAILGSIALWSAAEGVLNQIEASRNRQKISKAAQTPLALEGFDTEHDHELVHLLKAVLYSLNASVTSLFTLKDGELIFRTTNTPGGESLIPQWFAEDALRFRHTVTADDITTMKAIAPLAPEVVSVLATPVMEGSFMFGVLAVASAQQGAFNRDAVYAFEMLASQTARVLGAGRITQENERYLERLRSVHEQSRRLITSLDFKAIVDMVAAGIMDIAPGRPHVLIRREGGWTLAYRGRYLSGKRQTYALKGTLIEMAVSEQEHKYFSSLKGFKSPLLPYETPDAQSALVLPLCYEQDTLGVIVLECHERDALAATQVDFLRAIAEQATISLKNALFHAEVKRRALTDGLTGLCNHKHFLGILEGELEHDQGPLSLLLLDVDHFKQVNDTYGHQAGDAVLKGLAIILGKLLRPEDIPARYGGEEFAVLLPRTELSRAREVAQSIRRTVETTAFQVDGKKLRITISIGVAERTALQDEELVTSAVLMRRADEALYEAKDTGRNRVVVAGVPQWAEEVAPRQESLLQGGDDREELFENPLLSAQAGEAPSPGIIVEDIDDATRPPDRLF